MSAILSAIGGMYEDNLYLSTLYEYLDTPVAPPPARRRTGSAPGTGLRFEQVSFTYPGATEPAVRDVSFTLRPGESLALVGENGSGKTTLIKLLTRLYTPDSGRILLDGTRPRGLGAGSAAPAHRRDLPGLRPLPAQGRREHRRGRRDAFRGRGALARSRGARHGRAVHRGAARRLLDAARQVVQGRPRTVRRPVAEDRAVTRVHARGRRHPGARRADGGDGRARRGAGVRAVPGSWRANAW